jgi:hypothetical protein
MVIARLPFRRIDFMPPTVGFASSILSMTVIQWNGDKERSKDFAPLLTFNAPRKNAFFGAPPLRTASRCGMSSGWTNTGTRFMRRPVRGSVGMPP